MGSKLIRLVMAAMAVLVTLAAPQMAQSRVVVGFGIGVPLVVGPPAVVYPYPVYPYPPPAVIYAPPYPSPYPPAEGILAAPAGPVYQDQWGRTCREYQSDVVVGGVKRPAYGTACLQPDGTWKIVG